MKLQRDISRVVSYTCSVNDILLSSDVSYI